MAEICISREYPHQAEAVWQALTEPELVARWTTTGRGGRPEGFEARVGCRFRFGGRPVPGWDGIVRCEVLEVRRPQILRYSWQGGEHERPTDVLWRVEPRPAGTRLTYLHTGFNGLGGQVMSRLLGRVRRRMLDRGLPDVLDDVERETLTIIGRGG